MTSPTPQQRAAQRRRRRMVTFITLPGLLIGAAGITTAYAEGWITPPTKQVCQGQVVKAPAKTAFRVDVLNGTYRPGTAGTTAKLVAKHGFTLGTIGTDVAMRTVRGTGEIRYPAKLLDAALLVQKQLLPTARLLPDDETAAGTVALVLGVEFKSLLPLPPRPPAQPSKIVVNVYNTTYYEGLGQKVSTELTHRGFLPGKVGLDPLNSWQQGIALIRYGEDGDLGAKLVQQHFPGATLQQDGRKDTSVDVVIGMQLTDLTKMTPVDKVPAPVKYVPPPWPTVVRPCSD